jgi:hypothetical protein
VVNKQYKKPETKRHFFSAIAQENTIKIRALFVFSLYNSFTLARPSVCLLKIVAWTAWNGNRCSLFILCCSIENTFENMDVETKMRVVSPLLRVFIVVFT